MNQGYPLVTLGEVIKLDLDQYESILLQPMKWLVSIVLVEDF
jgi:hypothetical protein